MKEKDPEDKVKDKLSDVNDRLKALLDAVCMEAECHISEVESKFGKNSFIKALQYLTGKNSNWYKDLGERMKKGSGEVVGFGYDKFKCEWEGIGGGHGAVYLSFMDKNGDVTKVYRIPAKQNGNGRYMLDRPKFYPVEIDEKTGKIHSKKWDDCIKDANAFLEAAQHLPNILLHVVSLYVNYTAENTIKDLDNLIRKYGVD